MTEDNGTPTLGSAELTQKAETLLGSMEQAQETSAPQAAPQAAPESSPEPAFNDDTLVTVKIDGQEQQVPFRELKNGYSRESVFTQRMQNIAKQKNELEQYFAEQQAQVLQQQRVIQLAREELQRTNPLQQLLQQAQQQREVPKNPNEIATLGEIQAAQQQVLQHMQQLRLQDQQAYQQALAQARMEAEQNFETRRDQARFTDALTKVLESEDGKLLAELSPQAESIIRFETMKMGPESVDEAIEFMRKYVDEWGTKVKGRVQATSAVTKARTVMEPPSGSPAPTIQQPKIQIMGKDGSVNYQGLFNKALSLMD